MSESIIKIEWTWQMVDQIISDAKSVSEYPSNRIAEAHNTALAALLTYSRKLDELNDELVQQLASNQENK